MIAKCHENEHKYEFARCTGGEEIYECKHCGDEIRQYADLCSGG